MPLHFQTGDATAPTAKGTKLIVHLCNDIGGWGRGFVLALSRRWPLPEQRYRAWHRGDEKEPFALGQVQFVQVESDVWVANLIGQRGIRSGKRQTQPPIRYDAVRAGLNQVALEAQRLQASIHMPRIGCGLAGGDWNEVEKIISEELIAHGLTVTVYDLPA